jgi:hypothetical protein
MRKVFYSEIKTIYISLSRRSVLMELAGLYGAPVALSNKNKLLLSMGLADRPDKTRNAVFYLPAGAGREFIKSLEKKTGRLVATSAKP